MRYAIIENNIVVNVIVATPEFVWPVPNQTLVLLADGERAEIDNTFDANATPRFAAQP